MSIVLYGMPPLDQGIRWPQDLQPHIPQAIPSSVPMNTEAILAAVGSRIVWLKRELSMHEAWKLELATLERMVAPPLPGTEVKT